MKIGRCQVKVLHYRFGPYTLRLFGWPEYIGNGYMTAGGSFVREDGGFWFSSMAVGRFEVMATWEVGPQA